MAKKTYTAKVGGPNRVWIELERPDYKQGPVKANLQAHEIAALADKMIARLCGEKQPRTSVFWHEGEQQYAFGDASGYVTAGDNGHWFNLDYFGRD